MPKAVDSRAKYRSLIPVPITTFSGTSDTAMQVSPRTVYRMIKSGELTAIRFKNEFRIGETDIKKYLDAHRTKRRGD